jgi:hypothetical protein
MLPAPNSPANSLQTVDDKALARIQRVRDAVFHPLIEELAGKDNCQRLKEALASSSQPKAHQLLADMLDPRYRKWNVSQLARKAGIEPPQLLELWRSYSISRGISLLTQSAEHVARDIATDSRSKPVCCPRCDGWGVIERQVEAEESNMGRERPNPSTDGEAATPVAPSKVTESRRCPQCRGSGAVLESGDPASRKLMFEALGYTGKVGPMIQQTNIQINSIESALDGLESIEERAGVSFSTIRQIQPPAPTKLKDEGAIDAEVVD